MEKEFKVFTCISCGKQMKDEDSLGGTLFEMCSGIHGGIYAIVRAGYGSGLDDNDVEIVICDECAITKCNHAHRMEEDGTTDDELNWARD